MHLALILFLFSIWPIGSSAAEVVEVASGEHESYTRLVFTISPDKEWRLETGESSARLVFPTQNLVFEDERVFARIPKTRLVSVSSGQQNKMTEFHMALGCDCDVEAFSYLNTYIVVDISDRSNSPIMITPTRQVVRSSPSLILVDADHLPPVFVSWASPLAPFYRESPHEVSFSQSGGEFDSFGLSLAQAPDVPPNAMLNNKSVADFKENTSGSEASLQEAVDTARVSLLHELTLAADQGLLDLNEPISEPYRVAKAEQNLMLEEDHDEPLKPEDEIQVFIQTVYSRDANPAALSEESQRLNCPSNDSLDIASWGSGTDFSEEFSDARKRLLGEFDEPDIVELERLIHTYIRYGFGAEAISYLSDGNLEFKNQRLLLDLAAIVDGQPASFGGPLSKATDCVGLAGLWALVGTYPNVEWELENADTIIDAFADLPPDIRRLFGPRLVSAFVNRGHEALSQLVADILERAPGAHGGAHDLIVGNLMETEGREAEAGEVYRALIENSSIVATDALIELATLELHQDRPASIHLQLDLGTAAKIERGTQRGGTLRRLESLWMEKSGNEARAINLLTHEMRIDPMNTEIYQRTAEEILSGMSLSAEFETSYVEIVHSYAQYISENESADSLRRKIAQKLLQLGLPDYALNILRPSLQRHDRGAGLLAARANLRAYRPKIALKLLEGATSDAARLVRVEALLGIEDFESALSELVQIEFNSKTIISPHWFSGNWAIAASSNVAAAEIRRRYLFEDIQQLNVLTNLGEANSDASEPSVTTLSGMRDILKGSETISREMENTLLNDKSFVEARDN